LNEHSNKNREDELFDKMMKDPSSVSMKNLNKFKSALLLRKGMSNKVNGSMADIIGLKIKKKMMEL
jgi:hypothetical protein